mmetsp:Transcript_27900/g.60060  ORF Transcript_27900/g.60060 Transcript_27900/m.60060 type:complete len:209 (+) Transcript_27900:85-711(+)
MVSPAGGAPKVSISSAAVEKSALAEMPTVSAAEMSSASTAAVRGGAPSLGEVRRCSGVATRARRRRVARARQLERDREAFPRPSALCATEGRAQCSRVSSRTRARPPRRVRACWPCWQRRAGRADGDPRPGPRGSNRARRPRRPSYWRRCRPCAPSPPAWPRASRGALAADRQAGGLPSVSGLHRLAPARHARHALAPCYRRTRRCIS